MRLSVETSTISFVTAGPAEPAIDFDTKAPKADENGEFVFNVHLFSVGVGGRDVIPVKVSGEPKGIAEFTPVRVTELVATTWAMGDRSGRVVQGGQSGRPKPHSDGAGRRRPVGFPRGPRAH